MHYPWGTGEDARMYSAPQVYKKVAKKVMKKDFQETEQKKALARLEDMYVAGELEDTQKRRLQKYWSARAKKEIEKTRVLGG